MAFACADQDTSDQESQVATDVAKTVEASEGQIPTQAPPEDAPQPTPTNIPGDPAEVLDAPNGKDTFDNANNWTHFDNDCFKSEIKDGKFIMTAKGVEAFSCWERSWPEIEDAYIQFLVEMPETCNKDDRFGLIFRMPDNKQGYLYGLTCDGRYSMTSWDGETTNFIASLANSGAIKSDPGDVNRIGVVINGESIDLYANGVLLTEVADSQFEDAGFIGLFVRAAKEDEGFVVRFDELSVWVLEQN